MSCASKWCRILTVVVLVLGAIAVLTYLLSVILYPSTESPGKASVANLTCHFGCKGDGCLDANHFNVSTLKKVTCRPNQHCFKLIRYQENYTLYGCTALSEQMICHGWFEANTTVKTATECHCRNKHLCNGSGFTGVLGPVFIVVLGGFLFL